MQSKPRLPPTASPRRAIAAASRVTSARHVGADDDLSPSHAAQSILGAGSTIGPPGSGNVGRGRGRGNPVPQPGPVQPSPFGPGRTPPATVTSVWMSMDTIVSVAVTFESLFFMTTTRAADVPASPLWRFEQLPISVDETAFPAVGDRRPVGCVWSLRLRLAENTNVAFARRRCVRERFADAPPTPGDCPGGDTSKPIGFDEHDEADWSSPRASDSRPAVGQLPRDRACRG